MTLTDPKPGHDDRTDDHTVHTDDRTGHPDDHTGHADDRTVHADDHTVHPDDHTVHADDHTVHPDDHTGHADDHTVHAAEVRAAGPEVDMSTDLAGALLPNPLMTASGCAANGKELHRLVDITALGAFVTKSVMERPRSGRGTPRMAETASGMLNSIGLQGPGIEAFVGDDLPWLRQVGARVLVSIAGGDSQEFGRVATALAEADAFDAVVGVEVNISCPNVADRGLVFACDPQASTAVVRLARASVPAGIPIFAKLTPDVTDIVTIARAAMSAGADGLTLVNTLLGMVIDTDRLRPQLAGVTGGLSGPAIRPVAVRAVWQVRAAMLAGLVRPGPIIGVGGVRTGLDALELVAAGASAVQVGTATFNDPAAPVRVNTELAAELAARGFARFTDAVGVAHERWETTR
ncbi:MAG TPA: dihydroorotate dehydrogenase [Dermatophilaceae bacterium]|nr:dihydroorotate dehydrogenase [Dermatophilaceae bacterium]